MEEKRRSKRAKPIDEGFWDCSVCTYKNSPEAFKCDMCDVRKGTSTRKPRLNAQLVAQQAAQQYVPVPPKKDKPNNFRKDRKECGSSSGTVHKKSRHPARLKNIDKSTATSVEVTVNNLTVIITDYTECKVKKERRSSADTTSSNQLSMSTTSIHSDSGDSNMSTLKSEVNGDMDMLEEGEEEAGEEEEQQEKH